MVSGPAGRSRAGRGVERISGGVARLLGLVAQRAAGACDEDPCGTAEAVPLDYRDAGLRLPSVRGGVQLIAASQAATPVYGREAVAAALTPLAEVLRRSSFIGIAVVLALSDLPPERV